MRHSRKTLNSISMKYIIKEKRKEIAEEKSLARTTAIYV